ncbi:hypothetical protein SLEP1_g24857 [Rubroshorea leprosula]|uniref:Uncharacterized protein n=1 Tax=Rubroshorea leprosula TaxID=152421 RepID=A0AAV5JP83_9ROSI|nr:hypothetical protein SLEP1_g24857 [Rubroshorea leprosula]
MPKVGDGFRRIEKWGLVDELCRKLGGFGCCVCVSMRKGENPYIDKYPIPVLDCPVILALGLGLLFCVIKVVRPNAWEARGSDELDG